MRTCWLSLNAAGTPLRRMWRSKLPTNSRPLLVCQTRGVLRRPPVLPHLTVNPLEHNTLGSRRFGREWFVNRRITSGLLLVTTLPRTIRVRGVLPRKSLRFKKFVAQASLRKKTQNEDFELC